METGGRFGWKILLMVALLTAGMGGALDAEATDCALAITDWEEYCCVEKVDEWSGTVKCTLSGVERQEMKDRELDEKWTAGDPFTIEGTRGEDNEDKEEYYLYLDLGLEDGTEPGEYTANVTFEAYYKDEEDPVCDGKIKVEVAILSVDIENTAPRNTDDIQVQCFTNNAGAFTYTAIPLQVYYRLQPASGWTPDSVELRIKNPAGSTVRTITLPTIVGQQQTAWDGKDNSGSYVANGSNYVVEIAATIGETTCTATNGLTVYEIRQGNCVYRPIRINEHAAILYEYLGGNRLTDVQNNNNYRVMEHPGTGGTTGLSNYGNFNNWIGAFCPPGLSRTQRKAILEQAHELDNANIPYVSFPYLNALHHNDAAGSPAGTDWAGTMGDILRIRCDGTVEVAYEDVGERLYGGDAWWNIMTPGAGAGSNLDIHNDGADSINPQRQRDGINAAHDLTRNREDAIHLP